MTRKYALINLFSVLVILFMIVGNSKCMGFSTKKIERSYPAFKKAQSKSQPSATTYSDNAKHNGNNNPTTAPFGMYTASKVATAVSSTSQTSKASVSSSSSIAHYYDDHEDDEAIIYGYGTIVLSCALSIALGFSLGYGT